MASELYLLAMRDVREGRLSARAAAIKHGLKKTALLDRLSGKVSCDRRKGPHPILSPLEESQFAQWYIEMSNRGFGLNKDAFKETVKTFLDKDGRSTPFRDNKPGDKWYRGFCSRNPEVKKARPLKKRADIATQEVGDWFTEYESFVEQKREREKERLVEEKQAKKRKRDSKTGKTGRKQETPKKLRPSCEQQGMASERYLLAMTDVREGRLSARAAAIKHGLKKTALLDRLSGKVKYDRRKGPHPILSKSEESQFAQWYIGMSNRGFGLNKDAFKETVKTFLDKDGRSTPFRDNKPGDKWYRGFCSRNPEVKKAKPLKKGADIATQEVGDWFTEFESFVEQRGEGEEERNNLLEEKQARKKRKRDTKAGRKAETPKRLKPSCEQGESNLEFY